MKVSELIQQLEQAQAEWGDLEVFRLDDSERLRVTEIAQITRSILATNGRPPRAIIEIS